MGRGKERLTALEVKNPSKPKLSDGGGLYLIVGQGERSS